MLYEGQRNKLDKVDPFSASENGTYLCVPTLAVGLISYLIGLKFHIIPERQLAVPMVSKYKYCSN